MSLLKQTPFQLLVVLGALSVAAGSCLGAVVGVEDASAFSDPGSAYYGVNPDYVYVTRGGTSVAIGYSTMLTADHYYINTVDDGVAGYDTFTINGDTWCVSSVELLAPDPGKTSTPDIRVLHMENLSNPYRPLPGYYELYDAGSWPSSERNLVMIGTGDTGVDHVTYYTDTDDTRDLRWGTNRADSWTYKNYSGYRGPHTTLCFNMDYRSDESDHEVGLGMGDSGCAFLTNDVSEGVWKLAGFGLYRYEQSSGSGKYYSVSAASIPFYASRLEAILADDLLFGDTDGDGDVDLTDYVTVEANFGLTGATWADGDFDGDGFVGVEDYFVIKTNLGYEYEPISSVAPDGGSSEQSLAVPEPASVMLLGLGAAALLRRRRRQGSR